MLLRFSVFNHRSILDAAEFSMIAVDKERSAVRSFELLNEGVLPVAGIYGPNASGKSNLLDALAWLGAAVSRSLRAWDEFIPRDPFRFGAGPSEPSIFEIEMMVEGVRHSYELTVTNSEVLHEALHSYPQRKRRTIFERNGEDLQFRRGLGGLAGTRGLLTPRTLALSAAMRFDDESVTPFARQLASIRLMGAARNPYLRGFPASISTTERWFVNHEPTLFEDINEEFTNRRDTALALLRFADLGIGDVQIVEEEGEDARSVRSAAGTRGPRRSLRLVHKVGRQEEAFELEDESVGTRTWFRLIGPTLNALERGQLLLFDELDASLHPRLSARLVSLFQDPATNRRGAQLVFTSHDTSLLNTLNRDEVWLTEKGVDGASRLAALAEYGGERVRQSVNIERAYLQGRFGAVPELDQIVLRRAMGLLLGEESVRDETTPG